MTRFRHRIRPRVPESAEYPAHPAHVLAEDHHAIIPAHLVGGARLVDALGPCSTESRFCFTASSISRRSRKCHGSSWYTVVEERPRRRLARALGFREGPIDIRAHLRPQPLLALATPETFGLEMPSHAHDRIAPRTRFPAFCLARRRRGSRRAERDSHGLHQRCPRSGRSARTGLAYDAEHSEDVAAVHAHSMQAVGERLDGQTRARGLPRAGHGGRPAVVSAESQ